MFSKLCDLRSEILFVDHVKTCNEFCQSFVVRTRAYGNMIEHLLDMLLSNNFEASQNQPEFEMGSLYLEFINHCADNSKLLDEGNILLVVTEQHTTNMSILYYEYILVNTPFKS